MKKMSRKMEIWNRWPWMKIIIVLILMPESAKSDPQTALRSIDCSSYGPTNIQDFLANLNATLAGLRVQLSNESKHFAMFQQTRSADPVYAMVQCMNYLSAADCLKCYDTAVSQLKKKCVNVNGARIIYDGCSLRYESNMFFDQATLIHTGQRCANQSVSQAALFRKEAERLMKDLQVVTPKTQNLFAAVKKEVPGGADTIYAVAQCAGSISPDGCQDCFSVAYGNIQGCFNNTDGRAFDVTCFLRYSNTRFFSVNQTTDITPFIRKGNSSKSSLIIGGVSAGIGFLLVVVSLFLLFEFLKKQKARKGDILEATRLKGPLRYNYDVLKNATKHFHEENKLGEGGFGEVYKGILKNGNVVAVKKLTLSSERAKAEFDSEVRLISNVNHRNLIRLLGFSSHEGELLLVYEYMKNGSLDRFLFGEERGKLKWRQRYEIIIGTARGLAYLHEQFHVCIIHRDMKSSNILLDDDFQPKIADFGLARLLPGGHTHLSTRFAGTLGYTAPEYALYGHLSEKVDIYGFGVVILEIISGRRSTDVKFEPVGAFLLEEAWNLCQQDMHLKLVDETLNRDEYTPEEMKKVIGVALACTQSPSSARPSMSSVVAMLSAGSSMDQQLIGKPTFVRAEETSAVEASIFTRSPVINAGDTSAVEASIFTRSPVINAGDTSAVEASIFTRSPVINAGDTSAVEASIFTRSPVINAGDTSAVEASIFTRSPVINAGDTSAVEASIFTRSPVINAGDTSAVEASIFTRSPVINAGDTSAVEASIFTRSPVINAGDTSAVEASIFTRSPVINAGDTSAVEASIFTRSPVINAGDTSAVEASIFTRSPVINAGDTSAVEASIFTRSPVINAGDTSAVEASIFTRSPVINAGDTSAVEASIFTRSPVINAGDTSAVEASVSTHSPATNSSANLAKSSGRQTLASLFVNT